MSATSIKVDQILRSGLLSTLKQEGFRKSAHTFRRVLPNCTQITNVQGSWTNIGDQGQFTINLGVYYPDAVNLQGLFNVTDRPLESDCMIRQRIGLLMPVRCDYWWKFDASSDLEEIAKEVVDAWTTFGRPWLDECSTLEGALQFVLSIKYHYWASIFSLLQGDRENARRFLDEAIIKADQSPNKGVYLRLRDWGNLQGLIA